MKTTCNTCHMSYTPKVNKAKNRTLEMSLALNYLEENLAKVEEHELTEEDIQAHNFQWGALWAIASAYLGDILPHFHATPFPTLKERLLQCLGAVREAQRLR